eukprot:2477512-Pyramimonas_sp.AAC.1
MQEARQHAQGNRSVMELLQRIERGQKNASRKDYYKILGVNKWTRHAVVGCGRILTWTWRAVVGCWSLTWTRHAVVGCGRSLTWTWRAAVGCGRSVTWTWRAAVGCG